MLINIDSKNKLVLASSSPRRKELLKSIKVPFIVVPAEIDELARDGEEPEDHVQRLAHEKASEISKKYRDSWVLGADTIVVIDGRILGKPYDEAEALKMLSILSGRTHIVLTGYAIINSCYPEMKIVAYARSEVFIRTLSKEEIQGYVLTGEPMDKAGAYAIQDVGAAIVERVCGSYTNVVGLPLCEVARDFRKLGIYDFLGVD